MKAIVVQTPGDPEVMHLGEVPDRTRGHGEVLVRTGATPVHHPTPAPPWLLPAATRGLEIFGKHKEFE
jgi:hypothetical protein